MRVKIPNNLAGGQPKNKIPPKMPILGCLNGKSEASLGGDFAMNMLHVVVSNCLEASKHSFTAME